MPWLRKAGNWDGKPDAYDPFVEHYTPLYWVYFGDVPPDRIVSVSGLPQAKVAALINKLGFEVAENAAVG